MKASGFHTRRLAIVGLGLMGGSLALALREHADEIVGIDPNPVTCEYAQQHGTMDHVTSDLRQGVKDADTVVLAAPVRVIVELLNRRIGSYLRSNTLLIDIGSTKNDIVQSMGRLPIGIQAIGGHPMTGKEVSGIEAADADLYRDRPFVLCETRRATPSTRLRALSLVDALGAVPVEIDAAHHDRVVAMISHVPYLLSAALMATAAGEAVEDEAIYRLAAGGFRDMSRLAGSDVRMMGDIVSTNTQAIAVVLAQFRVQLALLEKMLIGRDEVHLTEALEPIRESRIEWAKTYLNGNGSKS